MSDSEAEDYGMGEALPEAGIEGRRVMPLRHDKGALTYAGGLVGRYLRDVEDLVMQGIINLDSTLSISMFPFIYVWEYLLPK